jgi:hypothetical protein
MARPRSIVRKNKDGSVWLKDNIKIAEHTIDELTLAALQDVGKLIAMRCVEQVKKIDGGSLRENKRPFNAYQYWLRRIDMEVQVGIKHDTWYGVDQEMGLDGQPKRDILRKTVMSSLGDIEKIYAHFLGQIENERA